jgi:hypothetical protein
MVELAEEAKHGRKPKMDKSVTRLIVSDQKDE